MKLVAFVLGGFCALTFAGLAVVLLYRLAVWVVDREMRRPPDA